MEEACTTEIAGRQTAIVPHCARPISAMVGRARGRGAGRRGGANRGQGRKSSSATPAARPAAPDATSTKKQTTLATLLGPRHEASALFTPRRPAVLATDVIKWQSGRRLKMRWRTRPRTIMRTGDVRCAGCPGYPCILILGYPWILWI